MDRWSCDRMFVAVMERGSFAAAAARLGVSSGQASKLVARLEEMLGTQLLHRTTRALSPTEAGRAYFERMRELLAEIDALDSAMRNRPGEPKGRLRITAPASFGVREAAPALLALAERHPGLDLDVSFNDRPVDLIGEGFDAAIRIGAVDDLSLIVRKLTKVRISTCAAPNYLEAHGDPERPEALSGHACIIDSNFRDPYRWRFSDPSRGVEVNIPVVGRLTLSSAEACLMAAERGLGIAHIPSFIARRALRDGVVRPVLVSFEPEPLQVSVLYPPTRFLSPKTRVFVDFLADWYLKEERR